MQCTRLHCGGHFVPSVLLFLCFSIFTSIADHNVFDSLTVCIKDNRDCFVEQAPSLTIHQNSSRCSPIAVIHLDDLYLLSKLCLRFVSINPFQYSVRFSTDSRQWITVIGHRGYKCFGVQELEFTKQAVR